MNDDDRRVPERAIKWGNVPAMVAAMALLGVWALVWGGFIGWLRSVTTG